MYAYLIISILHFASLGKEDNYSFASQDTILAYMAREWGVIRCRRTLNRWLRRLEDDGKIKRRRRHFRNKAGCLTFQTTIIILKRKAYQFLSKFPSFFRKIGWKMRKNIKKNSNILDSYHFPSSYNDSS